MKRTYCCSNVKFCMEDEKQRRTWEYLHSLERKDGSYGKIISEAVVTMLELERNQIDSLETELRIGSIACAENRFSQLTESVADKVLEGIKEFLGNDYLSAKEEEMKHGENVFEQKHKENLSAAMLDFGISMGE